MSDETIIYSADVWPSVSVGMPEVQAHAMSCPQAQERPHVTNAGWEAYSAALNTWTHDQLEADAKECGYVIMSVQERDALVDKATATVDKYDAAANRVLELQAEVQRLSAELAHRTQLWEGEEFKLRGELSEAKSNHLHACKLVADMHAAAVGEMRGPKRGVVEDVADLREAYERLRKELEDERVGSLVDVGGRVVDRDSNGIAFRGDCGLLDPRLGLPQPDGEPVAPMSAKKPYRWGMV